MSEKVQSFNPILVLIWILQIIILAMDYSDDGQVKWAIPVIGSFLLVQIYMVWKTNYDEMMEEQREALVRSSGDTNIATTPMIKPGQSNLQNANKSIQSAGPENVVQLNLAPSVQKKEKSHDE